VAEREAAPGWVPIAIEKRKIGWKAIALSECAPGQWWVTAVNRVPIDFASGFRSGSSVGLTPGDRIDLTRIGADFRRQILDATHERLRQAAGGRDEVRVLLIDGAVDDRGQPVGDGTSGSASFQSYATVRLSVLDDPDPRRVALGIEWLDQGTGPLNAGDSASAGRVRLVE
jgi:hypothetical protein